MKQFSRSSLSFLLLLCMAMPILAEEKSVRPGINDHYQNPDFKIWQQRFESPGREVFDLADDIVDSLKLKPGMHIADVGAGTGLFTRKFSARVTPAGRVYAVDISREFINNIKKQAQQAGIKNIHTLVNTDKSTGLTKNSVDLVFLCDTYHHFEYPMAMLKSIYQSLKKDGRLVVIDFRKDPALSSGWVMGHVRANQKTVRQEIETAGFHHLKDHDFLQSNYFMEFRK